MQLFKILSFTKWYLSSNNNKLQKRIIKIKLFINKNNKMKPKQLPDFIYQRNSLNILA